MNRGYSLKNKIEANRKIWTDHLEITYEDRLPMRNRKYKAKGAENVSRHRRRYEL